MKQSAKYLLTFAALVLPALANAHGDAPKPKHGGIVVESRDIEYELVPKADSIALYVEDHGKKVDTSGASAKVTLLSGGEKTEIALLPAGENKLEAKGSFKVSAGVKAVSVVTFAGKPAATARFELK